MVKYGIPYQGSKTAIAEDIIINLPAGNRLVDLFGGGFAISHCALLSGKWNQVLYNDINPLLIPLIRDAIAGKYSYERFIPEFISWEEFFARKDTDGYIKWIWSFGNNGKSYIFGKDVESIKRAGHEWVFRGMPIPGFDDLRCDLLCDSSHYTERRKFLNRYAKKHKGRRFELEQLERLERLQQLERLERLEMTCMDYREYKYQDGDVVYCDIPYQNNCDGKADYDFDFDWGAFYTWAITRPFPVYFSSYKLGGLVWEKPKRQSLSATNNSNYRTEALYCVDNNYVPSKKYFQGYLFI